ncbi:MAG TPA: hypothetical protein VET84_10325 [Stellaceae bacterium]|nr:hypothetical protein [Stellaceae bacterium]
MRPEIDISALGPRHFAWCWRKLDDRGPCTQCAGVFEPRPDTWGGRRPAVLIAASG